MVVGTHQGTHLAWMPHSTQFCRQKIYSMKWTAKYWVKEQPWRHEMVNFTSLEQIVSCQGENFSHNPIDTRVVISSPKAWWWAYWPYVCMSTFSNIFSSETTGPIENKFHMEPPWDGETKVCSTSPGHMTKMAAMPIYGKNLKTSSSPELKGRWPWKLVCSIRCSSTTKFIQMVMLGWPWHILGQGQIWSLMLL